MSDRPRRSIKGAAKSSKADGIRGPNSKRIGRPSKWKDEYCQMLISHMNQGFSFASFAGVISVSKECIYNWEKTKPSFSDASKKGEALSLLRNEQILMGIAIGKVKGNVAAQIFIMKNRFGWRDKLDAEITTIPKPTIIELPGKTIVLGTEEN